MNLITSVQDKLKQQVPTDKQLQMSHFARLVELLNESAKNQQNSELIQLVQLLIQFQFPQHTYQMICNSFSLLIAKTGNEQIKQVVETLLQYINKKGSLKSIALTLLVTLIQLTKHEIQSFSYTLTQDITTTLMKLLKSSDYRLVLCNILQFLIESQKIEILKIALKLAQNEKLEVLQQAGMQTLINLMQEEVISEQMYLIAYKSDDSPLFYKYFSRYLFQQQNIVALTKKDKLKSQVQLQPREQAQKIFQLFDENLSKFPSNIVGNILIAYKKYCWFQNILIFFQFWQNILTFQLIQNIQLISWKLNEFNQQIIIILIELIIQQE